MSRILLHAMRILSLSSPVSTSTSINAIQQRRNSNRRKILSPKPKCVCTASGLHVPPVQSIADIEYAAFIRRLVELNPGVTDIKQLQADEALEAAWGSKVTGKMKRKMRKTKNGRTAEGNTLRFEWERLKRESEEYWGRREKGPKKP